MLICILGRQPGLSLAELESAIGPESVQPVGSGCAIVTCDPAKLLQQELGGTMKIADVIATIHSLRWIRLFSTSRDKIVRYMVGIAEGTDRKLKFGLSVYGLPISPRQVSALSFAIKKTIKAKGYPVHASLSEELALNSATVLHNGLTSRLGSEFLLIAGQEETYLARTISVQDIERYSKRDFGRPRRDTRVGMLPPKLAQMMLNLAKVSPDRTVLDPFCGTGVVLMEAALKHAKIMGSDIDPKMVEYTRDNLDWLSKEHGIGIDTQELACADATTHKWSKHLDCVVSETYLGKPLSYQPKSESLNAIVNECDALVTKFLTNLRPQLSPESRCCIAVPAWASPHGLVHLPVVGRLESLGYNRVGFSHASPDQLVYRRSDQIVARELLVLTPK
jgi:tRNA (guanine10-N2)-dimethyltransferase